MLDKIAFMETLHSVQEIAKTSLTPLSKEEIQTYFKEMPLTKEQEEMVYQYLQKPQEELQEEPEPDKEEGRQSEDESEETVLEEKKKKKEKIEKKGSAHFQMYLDEIGDIPMLGQEAEKVLYQKLVQGDDTVIPKISNQWLRHVIEIAENYVKGDVILDDVVQEGNIGLLMGLNQLLGCGQEEGVEEILEQFIREAMEAYVQEETGEEDQEHTIVGKVSLVHEAKEVLEKEQGSEPTVQQLSAYTRIPEEEIMDILSLVKEVKKQ